MPLTFSGTYTKNEGDEAAAGTVTVTHVNGTTDTATLDAAGSYTLELATSGGTVTIVETLDGAPAHTFKTGVTEGAAIDTSRDLGRVGLTQSGATAPVPMAFELVGLNDYGGGTSYARALAGFVFVGSTLFAAGASLGPVNLPAGGDFGLDDSSSGNVPPDVPAAAFANWAMFVSNAAGTEQLMLQANGLPWSGAVPAPAADTDWSIYHQVGTDLSISPGGRIQSAAGGLFWATATMLYAPEPG